ncbi:MAG: hypothetical protein FJ104_17835, partial [Deltaproteobacteria bacterium]|nr:hypothetical protein [Deltaproteobacteria bacterium]
MNPSASSPSVGSPPPLWFLSDGAEILGPVTTTTLVEGVARFRHEPRVWATQQGWNDWRRLSELREVGVFRRLRTAGDTTLDRVTR